jgi:hypothetical protein
MKTAAHDTTGLSSIRTYLRMAVPIMVYTTDPNGFREGAMRPLLSRCGGAADYCGATNTLFDGVMAAPVGHLAAFSHEHPARALTAMEICTAAPAKKP